MIISNKNKFIFIHIHKCAGTSITNSLSLRTLSFTDKVSTWLHRNFGLTKPNHIKYEPHITARDLREQMGAKKFDSYFSFAISRNPWDWQVSLYTYMRSNKDHWQHELALKFKDFDDYIRWRCDGNYQLQKEFVCSSDGELLLNFVGKMENLDEDFKYVCRTVGLPLIELKQDNVTNHLPYPKFYNDHTRELVETTFAEDIEFFGYSFDSQAVGKSLKRVER